MTGAEMKAWRERLGKDEAWIESLLDETPISRTDGTYGMRGNGYGSARRLTVEGGSSGYYSDRQCGELIKAYREALEAEEARQAAERAQAEPVCPEVVTVERLGAVVVVVGGRTRVSVAPDGSYMYANGLPATTAALRYAADLADHLAAKHAEGDRQRKLDAVRAAEDAWDAARKAHSETSKRVNDTHEALASARREAGL